MPLVIAVWPNNTISVLRMWSSFSMVDLFHELDAEADPIDATCYRVGEDDDGLHITFDWKFDSPGEPVMPQSKAVGIGKISGRIKKLPWPKDIKKQWWREMDASARRANARSAYSYLSSEEIPKFPSPPPPSHTADEVRAMPAFCGVYLAYNADGTCYYVGESENVTQRVSKSRPEIGERMLGLVRCEKSERKRIENYFCALLDPPGNAMSTHRMSQR